MSVESAVRLDAELEREFEAARYRNGVRLGRIDPLLQPAPPIPDYPRQVGGRLASALHKASIVELNGKEYKRVSLGNNARRLISPEGYYDGVSL